LEDLGGFETNILDVPGQPEKFPQKQKKKQQKQIAFGPPPKKKNTKNKKQNTMFLCFLGKLFLGPGWENLDSDSCSLFFGMFFPKDIPSNKI
jgi:hypothetical protein